MYKTLRIDFKKMNLLGRFDIAFNTGPVYVLVEHFFGKFVNICFVFQWTHPKIEFVITKQKYPKT